jgi:Putative zinc- or iron-chelating domain
MRTIAHRYRDPVDEIWVAAAQRLGLTIARSDAVYASYDGKGGLTLSDRAHFDPDDSLAQLIFHELCHALVAGDAAMRSPDWGLCNTDGSDLVREHACHRLQAALSARHGLRGFFAVTTDHRGYWDALPADPLAPAASGDADPAIELARAAWLRARRGLWAETLQGALAATQRVASAVRPFAAPDSLWRTTRALHRSGFPLGDDPARSCGDCAWLIAPRKGRSAARCRMTRSPLRPSGLRVEQGERACERFESRFGDDACASCGACCREGFDLVPVRAREAMARRHPELLVSDRHGLHVPRPGGRCRALTGNGESAQPYRCSVYADRPRACAQFELGGDACLEARRRVGLSR